MGPSVASSGSHTSFHAPHHGDQNENYTLFHSIVSKSFRGWHLLWQISTSPNGSLIDLLKITIKGRQQTRGCPLHKKKKTSNLGCHDRESGNWRKSNHIKHLLKSYNVPAFDPQKKNEKRKEKSVIIKSKCHRKKGVSHC